MIGDKKFKNKKGFTLIELLVGAAIFSLAIGIAIGLFATVMEGQRKSKAIQDVQENGRYLMWYISKEIRMSTIDNSADGETSQLFITHPEHGAVTYSFSEEGGFLRNGEKLNADEVNVVGKFIINGKTPGDNEWPRATVMMKVLTAGVKPEQSADIRLQTTFSQHQY